jgi:hypothetical protein
VGAGCASFSEFFLPRPGDSMLRRFTKAARVKALKMEPPSLAQGGLAFILAYTIAYAFFAV